MTGRIKSEKAGKKLHFFLHNEKNVDELVQLYLKQTLSWWKLKCHCQKKKKIILDGTLEHLPYRNAILDYAKFWKGRIMQRLSKAVYFIHGVQ